MGEEKKQLHAQLFPIPFRLQEGGAGEAGGGGGGFVIAHSSFKQLRHSAGFFANARVAEIRTAD